MVFMAARASMLLPCVVLHWQWEQPLAASNLLDDHAQGRRPMHIPAPSGIVLNIYVDKYIRVCGVIAILGQPADMPVIMPNFLY